MPVEPFAYGLATVKVGFGASGAFQTLGYTRNGVQISLRSIMIPVPGDAGGGDGGTPIDYQYLGEEGTIRAELTSVDMAVLESLKGIWAKAAGEVTLHIGKFIFGPGNFLRVSIETPTKIHTFPRCTLLNEPIEITKGTRYAVHVVSFHAHPYAGSLYSVTNAS